MSIRRSLRSADPLALERISLFSGCGWRELQKLERIGTRVHVKAGRTLVTAGDFTSEILLVLSGTASCYVDTERSPPLSPVPPSGEVATLCGGPRTATVTATTDMDLWVLVRGEFEKVLEISPDIARRMLCAMARRLRAADVAA